jgi:hypothetical protein
MDKNNQSNLSTKHFAYDLIDQDGNACCCIKLPEVGSKAFKDFLKAHGTDNLTRLQLLILEYARQTNNYFKDNRELDLIIKGIFKKYFGSEECDFSIFFVVLKFLEPVSKDLSLLKEFRDFYAGLIYDTEMQPYVK